MNNNVSQFLCPDSDYCRTVRASRAFEEYVNENGKLNERVLKLFFGYDDGVNLTIKEVCDKLRLNEEKVMSILLKAEEVYKEIRIKEEKAEVIEAKKSELRRHISYITKEEMLVLCCSRGVEDGIIKDALKTAECLGMPIEVVEDILECLSFRERVNKTISEIEDEVVLKKLRCLRRDIGKELFYLYEFGYEDIEPGDREKIIRRYRISTRTFINALFSYRRICHFAHSHRLKDFLD